MKNLLFIIIFLFLFENISAQKNEIELQLGMGQFQEISELFKQNKTYQSGMLSNNQIIRLSVRFNAVNARFFSTGIETTKYAQYSQNNGDETINLQELFFKVPLKYNIRRNISENSTFLLGVGIYSSVLVNQTQIKQDNTSLHVGFGNFSKAGICASGNYIISANDKNGFSIGFSVDNDIMELHTQNKDIVSNNYWSWSLDMGYFIKF